MLIMARDWMVSTMLGENQPPAVGQCDNDDDCGHHFGDTKSSIVRSKDGDTSDVVFLLRVIILERFQTEGPKVWKCPMMLRLVHLWQAWVRTCPLSLIVIVFFWFLCCIPLCRCELRAMCRREACRNVATWLVLHARRSLIAAWILSMQGVKPSILL